MYTFKGLIYRVSYLFIAFIGILLSLGLFSGEFNNEYLVYYTNLSNLIAFLFMLVITYHHYKHLNEIKRAYLYKSKFSITIMFLVTLIIYNTLLGNMFDSSYWQVKNVIIHLVAPIMVFIDFLVFDLRGTLKLKDIFFSLIIPYIYIVITFIRGAIVHEYPYFFLDINTLGLGGVIEWIIVLTFVFLIIALLLYVYNRYHLKNGKLSKNINNGE